MRSYPSPPPPAFGLFEGGQLTKGNSLDTNCARSYQGQVGAALVLGGYDATGPQLFTVAPHGSTDKLPYVTMGSGSLAAMAVFESEWKAGLSKEEAVRMVASAISAGIFNDLGSGSNVDVCIIEKDKTEMLRNFETPVRLHPSLLPSIPLARARRLN